MAESGQDSPMPDRSAVEAGIDASAAIAAEDVMEDPRANSRDSSDGASSHDSSDSSSHPANNAAASNSSRRSSDHSTSSNEVSKEGNPLNRLGWFPIHEDLSVAPAAEIAHIEALGEFSALDEAHWTSKFPELNDPEYVVSDKGKIEWIVTPFNGTPQNPKKDFVYTSPHVSIGGHLWRLKVFPKGLDGPYLAVNLECKKAEEEGQEPPRSVSDPTSEKTTQSQVQGISHASTLPWRLPAQFEVVVFNPQEPRVHFHKGSSQSFSAKSPSCSFKRVAPLGIADIGMRISGQRQALLRNDTLGVAAYIRTFRDDTGCLFLRNAETWDSFAISGFGGISGSRHHLQHSQSLLAAVTTWLFTPALQRIFAAVTELRAANPNLPKTPLVTSLGDMSNSVRDPDSCWHASAPLGWIEQALLWHVMVLDATADVFEAWELLKSVLYEEIKVMSSQSLMNDFDLLGPSRFAPRYDYTRTVKDVQSLMLASNLPESVSSGAVVADDDPKTATNPQVLHIQLPRQRFDSEKRKWKKSKRPYDLNEHLQVQTNQYRLQGLILHEESDLKSRSFSTIVRADGKHFYRYGPDYERVVRLTNQQALLDTRCFVYAVIYVLEQDKDRDSALQEQNQPKSATSLSETGERNGEAPVELTFVNSKAFDSSTHPGILDQYQLPSPLIYKLTFETADDVRALKGNVEEFFLAGQDDKKCYIWELKQESSRFNPGFIPANLSLEKLAVERREPALYFVRVGSGGEFRSNPSKSEAGTETAESADNGAAKPTQAESEQEQSLQKVDNGQAQDNSGDTTMVDVDMSSEASKIETNDPERLLEVYVFVKFFDIAAQSLRCICSYIARRDQEIQSSVRQQVPSIFEQDQEYEFFEDEDPHCDVASGPRRIFLSAAAKFNRNTEFCRIIIVQPVLSQPEKEKILVEGGIVDLRDFLDYELKRHIDTDRVSNSSEAIVTRRYFGASYYEGTYSRGKPHGKGKEITLGGEEYVGSFKMGLRNGKGFLRLQNNNTYEGDFWDGRPHGTGTHVEALTGNTYTGGFQRGKKRGRGTTEWKQAEEEAKVCRICYDNEQDCAFYPCGHVCACLECAKMASSCPMCHREGSRPFKLYFAS